MFQTFLPVITIVNIFILVFSTFNLFRRRRIIDFLAAFSVLSIASYELSKFLFFFGSTLSVKVLGISLCLSVLFWLVLGVSFFPQKSYALNRLIISPFVSFVSLVFAVIMWIKPFILYENLKSGVPFSLFARYFFVFIVFSMILVLSNLERSHYYLKKKSTLLLLISALLFFVPQILLSAYCVWFSQNSAILWNYSSLVILVGAVVFMVASVRGFSISEVKEETAVHTSMVLLLLGGYVFFIGAFIKLFHVFGWNLKTLFSFLTTVFVFLAFFFLVFSSSLKERLKSFLLKNFTRQKYDWQKIWEEFTYKISMAADMETIKQNIKSAISKIMETGDVKVFIFFKESPFEEGFLRWLLLKGEPFSVKDAFKQEMSQKYPISKRFFEENKMDIVTPLYGDKEVIGIIGLSLDGNKFIDKELLKILSLQASGVILNSWTNEKLHQSQRRESLYRLSTFVIHDVKNYINSLSLLIANKDKFTHPDFLKDALFTLENTVKKMKSLLEDFKSLRGDVVVSRKRHNLKQIVKDALSDIGQERFKEVDVSGILDDVFCEVDAANIHKVVLNLITNALEAMNNRGSLYIACGKEEGGCFIKVKDTGPGMSREFIKNKLFTPFSTTKEKGLGIGLYQCKAIIEAHGGDIEVKSKEKEGTTFKIILPISANSE